jgi:exopolysaccharide biosynthesis predicted pyruvyltransferase EpsI
MNSNAMEVEGLKRSLQFLKDQQLKIGALVTDRHPSITKMMREEEPYKQIEHYFDCWHVAKCESILYKNVE